MDGGYVNKNASAKFKALLDVSIARYKQVEPLIRRHEGRTSCTKLVGYMPPGKTGHCT